MPERGHPGDPGDIDLRRVGWGAAMVAGGIAFACAGAYAGFVLLRPGQGFGGPNAPALMRIAAPVLESAPQPSHAAYMAEKERLLNSYGWVDRRAGIARIPVEQAMRMMAGQPAPSGARAAR